MNSSQLPSLVQSPAESRAQKIIYGALLRKYNSKSLFIIVLKDFYVSFVSCLLMWHFPFNFFFP